MRLLLISAALSAVIGWAPAATAQKQVPLGPITCSESTQETVYTSTEIHNSGLASALNEYFSDAEVSTAAPVGGSTRAVVPDNTETLKITIGSNSCATGSQSSSDELENGTNNTCQDPLCVDDLGPTFSHLPPGSFAKIYSCGAGIEIQRTYVKNSAGQWQLVKFEWVMKDTCTIE